MNNSAGFPKYTERLGILVAAVVVVAAVVGVAVEVGVGVGVDGSWGILMAIIKDSK